MAARSSRCEYRLSLIPIDFSLTAGTAIPAPFDSPQHSPTLGQQPHRRFSSHPTTPTKSLKSRGSSAGPLTSHPPSPQSVGSEGSQSPSRFETASQRHLERINSRRRSEVPFLSQSPSSPISPISSPPRPSLSTIPGAAAASPNGPSLSASNGGEHQPPGRRSVSARRLLTLFSKKSSTNLLDSFHAAKSGASHGHSHSHSHSNPSPQSSTQSSLTFPSFTSSAAGYHHSSASAGFGTPARPDSAHTSASSIFTGSGSAVSTSPAQAQAQAPRPNPRRKKSGSWFGLVGKRRSGMWGSGAEFDGKVAAGEDELAAARRRESERLRCVPRTEPARQRGKSFHLAQMELERERDREVERQREEELALDESDEYDEDFRPVSPIVRMPPLVLPDFMKMGTVLDGGSLGGGDIFGHIR